MKNWKGKTGEAVVDSRYDLDFNGMTLDIDIGKQLGIVTCWGDGEEEVQQANIIADAFNTIQKCDLLPSELLERYNEAVNLIKGMKLSMQANPSFNPEGGEFFDFVESAEELIKKHESC